MIRYLWLALTLSPFAAMAQQCPNGDDLGKLCIAILGVQRDASNEYRFHYQKLIMDAACATKSDSDSVRAQKVQRMWKQYEDRLICGSTSFDVQNGSLLKLAVSRRMDDFVFDAACVWNVDLNQIDSADGRTVLDYTFKEYMQNEGTAISSRIKTYYDMLRFGCDGGRTSIKARHRDELCAVAGSKPEGCQYKQATQPPSDRVRDEHGRETLERMMSDGS